MNNPPIVLSPQPDLRGVWMDLFERGLIDRETRLTQTGADLLGRDAHSGGPVKVRVGRPAPGEGSASVRTYVESGLVNFHLDHPGIALFFSLGAAEARRLAENLILASETAIAEEGGPR